jgi:hypothetical protein
MQQAGLGVHGKDFGAAKSNRSLTILRPGAEESGGGQRPGEKAAYAAQTELEHGKVGCHQVSGRAKLYCGEGAEASGLHILGAVRTGKWSLSGAIEKWSLRICYLSCAEIAPSTNNQYQIRNDPFSIEQSDSPKDQLASKA